MAKLVLPLLAAVAACAPVAPVAPGEAEEAEKAEEAREAADGAMPVRSVPADGATVADPQTLSLTFGEPVRLVELVIAGPSGEMPVMITAPGEQRSYTLPLAGLESGLHQVRWRAVAAGGASREGRLSFTVR